MKGTNPNNANQRRLFYEGQLAGESGENRHPQIVMRELAEKYGFKILAAVPQSLYDGWDFWVEGFPDNVTEKYFFDYPWKPIGEA